MNANDGVTPYGLTARHFGRARCVAPVVIVAVNSNVGLVFAGTDDVVLCSVSRPPPVPRFPSAHVATGGGRYEDRVFRQSLVLGCRLLSKSVYLNPFFPIAGRPGYTVGPAGEATVASGGKPLCARCCKQTDVMAILDHSVLPRYLRQFLRVAEVLDDRCIEERGAEIPS